MADSLLEALRRFTDAQATQSPYATAVAGLTILRSDQVRPPDHRIFAPALCVVAQGAKWAVFGDRRLDYGPGRALVVSVEMPAVGRVAAASPTEPYLGLVLEFDLAIMRDTWAALSAPPQAAAATGPAVFVSDFDGPLAECVLRLVALLDTPDAIPVLYPAIMREICFWLLRGPHGGDIAAMVLGHGPAPRVIAAIHALRARFREPVRIEELAALAGMSPSAFHRRFKAVTAMTPIQFQKRLRLMEARSLMAAGSANAETAAFRVGYESASQFSREYARMFGAPPRRDMATARTLAA